MGLNSLLLYIFAGTGVFDTIVSWFYYENENYNLVHVVKFDLFLNPVGLQMGSIWYALMKLIFWVIIAFGFHKLELYKKI